jgi:hypothetical protein
MSLIDIFARTALAKSAPEHKDLRQHEQGSEDGLIPSRQPKWKIDIEIFLTLVSEFCCDICQRTAPTIPPQHQALAEQHKAQCQAKPEAMQNSRNWKQEDTTDKESPSNRMHKPDADKHGLSPRIELHPLHK